jgi:hypothetical protein
MAASPPSVAPASRQPPCPQIAELSATGLRTRGVDARDPAALRAAVASIEASIRALEKAAPDGIDDDAGALATSYAKLRSRLAAVGYDLVHLNREQRADIAIAGSNFENGDDDGENIGDYAEERCGLVGGYAIDVGAARDFCLAYQRYLDVTEPSDVTKQSRRASRARSNALAPVVDAAPTLIGAFAQRTRDDLELMARGRADRRHREHLVAGLEALRVLSDKICAIDFR